MKFVDEATIHVQAGKGGDGSSSFRREKYIPRGGPDGGDGGAGGSIYIEAVEGLSTLVDYRYARRFKAQNGEPGKGKQCTGRAGDDLTLEVPIGTQIYDQDTRECLGDLSQHGERILIAKGGVRGLGNINFKSSVNQAPTRTTKGTPGEERNLLLELKLLADVGLLGLPNAGKSTFIRAISAAKPRVADYPFTTLYPNLGVVKVEAGRSFVVADIPGLLEGASEGVGLGVQFLKHLSRTSVLLHILDVAPMDGSSPVEQAKSIIKELKAYSPDLAAKPRWLILNKIDLIDEEELQRITDEIIQGLNWQGPVYKVSAISGENTRQICYDLMESLSKHDSE